MSGQTFPEGWFFIKNLTNGYVLMADNSSKAKGEPIVISSLRTKDFDGQLWRHGEDGRLYNKQTGFVLDVAKGNAKVGAELVQQPVSPDTQNSCQTFGISAEGHIYLTQDSNLVLGIKDSFFTRREGQRVHLQAVESKHQEHKEQRWDFVVPVSKQSILRSASSSTFESVKNAAKPLFNQNDDPRANSGPNDHGLEIPAGSFPNKPFFLKSQANGYYIGAEIDAVMNPGSRLTLDPLRTTDVESQLWTFDGTTGHIINQQSGFVLTAEGLTDDAYICQSAIDEKASLRQTWVMTREGNLCLRQDQSWVLSFKDSWFGSGRVGAHVHLQKKSITEETRRKHQKFGLVLPVFKKYTAAETASEPQGVFPEGWFFIKSQAHNLVITVLDSGTLAAQAVAVPIDMASYARQLWSYKDGFLVNKVSDMVLDVKGGSIQSGAEICQYKKKSKENTNQKWSLSVDGHIFSSANSSLVLSVKEEETARAPLLLSHKNMERKGQRWTFVLPVFKKKTASGEAVHDLPVQKSVSHHYAQYPSGWFFVKSFASTSTKEKPLVLTADEHTSAISIEHISQEHWRRQLWTYTNGGLLNFQTQTAIDVKSIAAGASLAHNRHDSKSNSQLWYINTDGYLIHGSNPSLALVTELVDDKYKLYLNEYHLVTQDHRWGLLKPEITVTNNVQTLETWSVVILKEWRRVDQRVVQKIAHQRAASPKDSFFLGAQNGLALAPEQSEAFAHVVLRKMDYNNYENFKWTFEGSYVVHCATGLVLHAADNLVNGSHLQLRAKLNQEEQRLDTRQLWYLKTDGSIVSESRPDLGLGLTYQNQQWAVQLTDVKEHGQHFAWVLLYGKYSKKYSEELKKEVSVLVSTERVVLTVTSSKTASSSERKLVTVSYGVFPDSWFYIRSKVNEKLVVTTTSTKNGTKLILANVDFKIFRRQLWHYRDDGCLVNLESDHVIDIAGGALLPGSDIILSREAFFKANRKKQLWALSVNGHIHSKSRPGLVLGPKGTTVTEGTELHLQARGALSNEAQQWTFASPVYGKQAEQGEISTIEGINAQDVNITSGERYERTTKRVVIRRWGVFPSGGFFIRSAHGRNPLALTVDQEPIKGIEGKLEYKVVLRPLALNDYKWYLWTFENDHLINVKTGLALDGSVVKGLKVEKGLRTQLHVRETSLAEAQFWSMTANGEIHCRSNEAMIIGVADSERAYVAGSQVGLREVKVKRVNVEGREESVLQSEQWLRWRFWVPKYGTKETKSTLATAAAIATEAVTSVIQGEDQKELEDEVIVQGCEEKQIEVREEHEEDDGYSSSEEEEIDESKEISATSAEQTVSKTIAANTEVTATAVESKHYTRKQSYHISDSYVLTGSEKVVRLTTYHQGAFPEGYFFIRSSYHGLVLDVLGDIKEGTRAVITPLRTSDYASQLWTFSDGFLRNLKGQGFALDAVEGANLVSGDRAHLSVEKSSEDAEDQQWEYSINGLIRLTAKRSLVLSIQELRRSDHYRFVDVFVQDEKLHPGQINARPEQHWEILVPSVIPVDQERETSVKIIEAGKVTSVTSSSSAVLAFRWLKETFEHKLTANNQWPSAEKWFFIRYGSENLFLAAHEKDKAHVGLYPVKEDEDYKRFLWVFIDGQLINYKYMLCLALNKSLEWTLADAQESADQIYTISSTGILAVKAHNASYSMRTVEKENVYQLTATTETSTESNGFQLHVPTYHDKEVEKNANVAISTALSWLRSQRTEQSNVSAISTRWAVFPHATWFFLQVGKDLVLSVQNQSTGSKLVVRKLSFQDFKTQLWTFRDGLLINYGSSLVIDVDGEISSTSSVVQSTQAGVSTQKWSLTAEGHIQLESYTRLALGYSDTLVEGTEISLISTEESSSGHAIQWKFSVPVFKKLSKINITEHSSIEHVTKAIEHGAVIEKTEELQVAVHDSSSHSSVSKEHEEHGLHDALKDIGIVAVSGAAATAAVGAASHLIKSIFLRNNKKTEQQSTSTESSQTVEQQDVSEVVLDKSSIILLTESKTIVRSWRINFISRIRQCKTQKETVTVIDESRRDLYRRLDDHIRAHASVHRMITGKSANWEVSIQQVKELYRARLFDKTLDKLKNYKEDQVVSFEELDIESSFKAASAEIDKHYEHVLAKEQERTKTKQNESTVIVGQVTESERLLITVDSIKVIVRFWFVDLYYKLAIASKKGVSEEEIRKLVTTAREELTVKLSEVKSSISKTQTVSASKVAAVEHSVTSAIERSEAFVNKEIEAIHQEKRYSLSEQEYTRIIAVTEQRLTSELKTYQSAVTAEFTQVHEEVESSRVKASSVDQKTVEAAKQIVSAKVTETKTSVISWFEQVSKEINWRLEDKANQETVKEDTLAIVDAAQIELVSKIDEAKLVLRTYDSQLSHLTQAERRRIEYSLDHVKASVLASILYFKTSIQKQNVSTEQILQHASHSFGSISQHVAAEELEETVVKITKVKKESSKVSISKEKKAETSVQKKKSTDHSKIAAIGAATAAATAAAAIAGAAISHHYEHKNEGAKIGKKTSGPQTTVVVGEKSGAVLATHDHEKISEVKHVETLMVVSEDVKVTVREWFKRLNKKVTERARHGGKDSAQDINTIVVEAQEELAIAIEKAKRATHVASGSNNASFNDTLTWVRSVAWSQSTQIKQIGTQLALTQSDEVEQQLHTLTESSLKQVYTAVDQYKSSVSGTTVASAVSSKEKYEGVDYSETVSSVLVVDKAKAYVATTVEEVKTTMTEWFSRFNGRVARRVKQGGDNVSADVAAIVKEARESLSHVIEESKSVIDQRFTAAQTKRTESETLLVQEAHKTIETTLEQVQDSILTQITEVEKVTKTEETSVAAVKILERLEEVNESAKHTIHVTFRQSETVIGQHLEAFAQSTLKEEAHEIVAVNETDSTKKSSKQEIASAGEQYGLAVVAETTEKTTRWLSGLTDRITGHLSKNSEDIDQEVANSVSSTEQELDIAFEQAKSKISSDASSADHKHLVSTIDSLKLAAKERLQQIKKTVIDHKEDRKTASEKLNQIAEQSKHELSVHYESAKKTSEKIEEEKHSVTSISEKKKEDGHDKQHSHIAEKMLVGSAAVAAGTAIAVEIAKKLKGKKTQQAQEVSKTVGTTKSVTVVKSVEDVKAKFNDWFERLTREVSVKSKQSNVSSQEIAVIVEQSKKEFIEVIKAAKTNESFSGSYQQESLEWIEKTTLIQASRVQEIATESLANTSVDVESRLQAIHVTTTSEVNVVLEKCKETTSTSSTTWVGTSIEHLQEKENAVLDIKKEVSAVVEETKASLATSFKELSKRISTRIQQGGANTHKDVSAIIEEARNDIAINTEKAKVAASKRLASSETKTYAAYISVSTLVEAANAEIEKALENTETTILTKIDRIESHVSSIDERNSSAIIEQISVIEGETTREIQETIEKSKTGFIKSAHEHFKSGHTAIRQSSLGVIKSYGTAVTVEDITATAHKWLYSLTQKVSTHAKHGESKSKEDIEAIVTKENAVILGYLEMSKHKISKSLKSETEVQELHKALESIKTTLSKASNEIKTVGVEAAVNKSSTGGIERMTELISSNEKQIRESLVTVSSISVQVEERKTDIELEQETRKVEIEKQIKRYEKTQEHKELDESTIVYHDENASVSANDVHVTVSKWFDSLIVEVSERAKKGGPSASQDIDIIVEQSVQTISKTLKAVSNNAGKSISDESSVQRFRGSLEWAKSMIIQGATQVKAVGQQAAAASSTTGGAEQMTTLAITVSQQIHTELSRYKFSSTRSETKISHSNAEKLVEHEKKKEKIASDHHVAHERMAHISEAESKLSTLIENSKVVVVGAVAELVASITRRYEQGGPNVDEDVAAIIKRGREHISETIKHTHESVITNTSSAEFEEDEVISVVQSRVQESLKLVETTVETRVNEIQETVTKKKDGSVKEKLSVILEGTKSQVVETLEVTQEESVQILRTEKDQAKATVSIVDNVENVKKTVSNWHTRLQNQITSILSSNVDKKEEKISALIEEANSEINTVIAKARVSISKDTEKVKKDEKSRKEDLLAVLDKVQATTTGEVKQIHKISTKALKDSKINVKESIASIVKTSQEKIDVDLSASTAVIVGGAAAAWAASRKHHVVDVNDNASVITEWFKHVTSSLHNSVKQNENVSQSVTQTTEHAEQELAEIIEAARVDFVQRLKQQNLDEASFNYARKHYEASLETVRATITSQISEAKKVTVEAHSNGQVEKLEEKLTALLESSKDKIKAEMGQAVVITQKKKPVGSNAKTSGSVVEVSVEEDEEMVVIGSEEVQVEEKESTVKVARSESKTSNVSVSTVSGKSTEVIAKEQVSESITQLKADVATWFAELIKKVSTRAKRGDNEAATDIEKIVEEERQHIQSIINESKKHTSHNIDVSLGEAAVASSVVSHYTSTVEWISSLTLEQVNQIQAVALQSAASKSDLTSQMHTLVAATKHQIDTALDSCISHVSEQHVIVAEKSSSSSGVTETTSAKSYITKWISSLDEKIKARIQQGGSNVEQDTVEIIKSSEAEALEVIERTKSKSSSTKVTSVEVDKEQEKHLLSVEQVRSIINAHTTSLKSVALDATSGKSVMERFEDLVTKRKDDSSHKINLEKLADLKLTLRKSKSGKSVEKSNKQVSNEQEAFAEVEKKRHALKEGVIAGTLAIGAATAAAAVVSRHKSHKDESKVHKEKQESGKVTVIYDSTESAIENTEVAISEWFAKLTTHVSDCAKAGVASSDISTIVSNARGELAAIIQNAKHAGISHLTTSSEQEQYFSKIEWIQTVASQQATQIEHVGINAAASKTDMKEHIMSLASATTHQIEIVLDQLKTTVSQKSKTSTEATEVVQAERKKLVSSKVQETRATASSWFASLSESITARISQGGSNVREDVDAIVNKAEQEMSSLFKKQTNEYDEQTRIEIDKALVEVHESITTQITEVKKSVVEVSSKEITNTQEVNETISNLIENSKQKVDSTITSIAERVTTVSTIESDKNKVVTSEISGSSKESTVSVHAESSKVENIARQATDSVHEWYGSLKQKLLHLSEREDVTEAEATAVVAEAELEMNKKMHQLKQSAVKSTSQSQDSAHHVDIFFGNLHSTVNQQLANVKASILQNQLRDKGTVKSSLEEVEMKLKQDTATHVEVVKTASTTSKKTDFKDTVQKVALGSAAVAAAAAAAVAYSAYKDHKTEKTDTHVIKAQQKVEAVEISTIEEVKTTVNEWLASVTEKVTARTQQGGENVSVEVAKIIEDAQKELDTSLSHTKATVTKSSNADSGSSVSSQRDFAATVEWIKGTALKQATQIKHIATQKNVSAVDVKSQIENLSLIMKKQISSALDVHYTAGVIVHVAGRDSQAVDMSKVRIQNTSSTQKVVVVAADESKEQVQERTRKEMTVAARETKEKFSGWLESLDEELKVTIRRGDVNVREQVQKLIESAKEQVEILVQESKSRFIEIDQTSTVVHTSSETAYLVSNAHKQALDCLDSMKTVMNFQISVLSEVVMHIDIEESEQVEERLTAVIARTKERVSHTMDQSTEIAIASAFEGKTLTWIETTELPKSFGEVRAFAFDLVGTVVDYRQTLGSVWKEIIKTKDSKLSKVNFSAFAARWYADYLEQKAKISVKQTDDELLRLTLVRRLKSLSLDNALSQSEIDQLVIVWHRLNLFDEAPIGIQRLKKQSIGYSMVSFSHGLSTSTMVDLARHGCLCWHSQFTAEMFAGSKSKTSAEAVVGGVIQLLSLNPSEVAIVSVNPAVLEIAKKLGARTVLVNRENVALKQQYDVHVDGLDLLAESVETLLEHEKVVKSSAQKEASSGRTWFQRVVSTAAEKIEQVTQG